jgi:hypothetical protein
MKIVMRAVALTLAVSAPVVSAQPVRWTSYSIPETGTSVDFPSSIFTEEAGHPPHGKGERFQSADGRANLTIEATSNVSHDSPATFLAKMHPPSHIQYKRITPKFFAVSSQRGDTVWYDRCKFSRDLVHCVLINYPAREEPAWNSIVTRISLSLSGK